MLQNSLRPRGFFLTGLSLVFVSIPSFLLSGCTDSNPFLDKWVFGKWGGTLIISPVLLSPKQIHLDSGSAINHYAVVKGAITSIDENSAYLVITEDDTNLLVFLDEVPYISSRDVSRLDQVSILGTIQRGRRGLPYLQALAVYGIQ